jgi:cytosine/adenosine deaminase-related metal-dependent hydrolase
MRYITADYIFPVSSPPLKNGIVQIEDDGTIIETLHGENQNQNVEVFKGIICPGFINSHCHLEHSYLKNRILEKTGLTGFISLIRQLQKQSSMEEILSAIVKANIEMLNNGIVAVGDISNKNHSFEIKTVNGIYYHTFLEVFNVNPDLAEEEIKKTVPLTDELKNRHLHFSVTSHAPYSASKNLFELVSESAVKNHFILSMHNQESESENEMFLDNSGLMIEFFKSIGISVEHLKSTGKSSLQSVLPLLPKENKILLVHNTFTSRQDIQFAQQYSKNIYWCFCPNANLYIENALPDFEIFIAENAKCCVGTDSYASNWTLSILDELKTISKHNAEISLQILLQWATLNGAEFLGIQNQFGSIEKNKKPRLNLIENVDLESMTLTEKSKVKKLV